MIKPVSISTYPVFTSRQSSRIKYDSFEPTYDTFTGLKDKNTLLMDLGRKMYKKEDISIGMFDMDNFKSVNELLGYKTGDEFIKAISEDIADVAKKNKVDAYRFGGDEFVVLLFSGMNREDKLKVIDEVIDTVSKNPVIQGKSEQYLTEASSRLSKYESENNKIKTFLSLSMERDILYDICENGTIAKEDSYIQERIRNVETSLGTLRDSLTSECLSKATSAERKSLDTDPVGFFVEKYDKSHEIFRLKKWIKDFKTKRFNITGGVAMFKPTSYKGKQPIDLINEVGEHLKNSKETKTRYYVELQ